MRVDNRSGPLPVLAGVVALALVGCPAAPPAPLPGPPPAAQVETVDAAGLVVFTGAMPGGARMGFGLLNPRTGKATPLREVSGDGARLAVAGSPDGRTLAWVDAANVLHVGTLGLDGAGLPTLAETAQHKVTSSDALAFTSDGRRLYTPRDYVDPAQGPVPCDRPQKDHRVDTGGLHWVGHCGGHDVLFHDRTPMLALRSGGRFSGDGQWLVEGEPLHVPGRTLSSVVTGDASVSLPGGFVSPDNVVAETGVGGGTNGRFVKDADLPGAAVDRVFESDGVPGTLTSRALEETWAPGGALSPPKVTQATPGLDGLPASEGRRWYAAGPLPDASADLFFFAGWDIVTNIDLLYQQPKWGMIVAVSRSDGTVRRHAGTTLLGGPRQWGSFSDLVYGAAPRGCLMLGEGGWACLVGTSSGRRITDSMGAPPGGWLGERGGATVEWGLVGELVTSDGRHFVREGSVDGRAKGLCFTSVGDRSTACLDRSELAGMTPRLVVGHAVVPPAGAAASVVWVSRQGAYPGLEVRVFGSRFGTAGTLRIGDVAVPAANVSSWTEGEIVFTVPEGLPKAGRVLVDAGQGSDTGARAFHLWASQRWTGPLEGVPDAVTTMHQGLSAIPASLQGPGRRFSFADHDRRGPDLHTQVVEGRFFVDDDGACPERTLLWVADGPYATNRPLRCTGKLDPAAAWTLLPGPQVASADRAVSPRAQQFYGELLLVRDTGAPPMYGKASWTEFVQTIDGSVVPGAIDQGAPVGNSGAFPGVAAQGTLVELDDQSVLWPVTSASFNGAHRVVALDSAGRGAWTVRPPEPRLRLPFSFAPRSLARVGNVLVAAGYDASDNVRPAFALSRDLASFGPVQHGSVTTAGSFAPVFAVQGGRRKGFVGLYREGNERQGLRPTDGPRSLYTLALDGTLTEAALPLPPGCEALLPSQLDLGVLAARLFAWNRRDGRLFSLDTDDAAPAWQEHGFAGRPVTSFMVDARRQRALVAARDTLWQAGTDGPAFEPWPSPVSLPLELGPMTFTFFALDKDGYAHVGVSEWTGAVAPAPVTATLVGRPLP